MRHAGGRCHASGSRSRRIRTCTKHKQEEDPTTRIVDTGVVLSVVPIVTWKTMGLDKDDLIDTRIQLSAANKGTLRDLGRTPIIALNLGERNIWMKFLVVENLNESDQFILGRILSEVLM